MQDWEIFVLLKRYSKQKVWRKQIGTQIGQSWGKAIIGYFFAEVENPTLFSQSVNTMNILD